MVALVSHCVTSSYTDPLSVHIPSGGANIGKGHAAAIAMDEGSDGDDSDDDDDDDGDEDDPKVEVNAGIIGNDNDSDSSDSSDSDDEEMKIASGAIQERWGA